VIARKRWPPWIQSRLKSAAVLCAPPRTKKSIKKLTSKRRQSIAWLLLSCWFLIGPADVYAAVNSATGGIGGNNNGTLTDGDGTGAAQFELNSVQLELVMEARDIAGNVLADGANVTQNQEIYFVVYVDNNTDFTANGLTITDALNEAQFTFVADSMESTTVVSGSNAAARWAGTWTPLTDGLGAPDDEASAIDTGGPATPDRLTAGEVPSQVNTPLAIPAQTQRAIRFRVRLN